MIRWIRTLREHWPEVLIEGALLGIFMISAGSWATLLYAPTSPLASVLPAGLLRDALMGLAMGGTAVALIHSPWGKRSGAHMNPAVTLTFWRLGKVAKEDAVLYIVAQAAGGLLGVVAVRAAIGPMFFEPPICAVATTPGPAGAAVAFAAELGISALLMIVVLTLSNSRHARFTGWVAGVLVMLYITFEAPLSGMSMNPARSFASALPSGIWDGFWIYLTAPVLGMQLAATLYTRGLQARKVHCAKLDHCGDCRCIFDCGYHEDEALLAEHWEG